jgi:hypothetical protein
MAPSVRHYYEKYLNLNLSQAALAIDHIRGHTRPLFTVHRAGKQGFQVLSTIVAGLQWE